MLSKMKRALKPFTGSLLRSNAKRKSSALAMQHFRPTFEPLEERRLLSVIKSWDFESEELGDYTEAEQLEDFNVPHKSGGGYHDDKTPGNVDIVNDTINGVATQVMKIFNVGNALGSGFETRVELGAEYDEIYISYNVKLSESPQAGPDGSTGEDNDWSSTWGGKLGGGIAGLPSPNENTLPAADEGFIAKQSFREAGRITSYHYDHTTDKTSNWNYGAYNYNDVYMNNGQWYNITQRVVLNTFTGDVANEDGINEVWADGRLIYQETNLKYTAQKLDEYGDPIKIDMIHISNFFGGSAAACQPARDCYGYLDNISVYLPDNDPTLGTHLLHNPNVTLDTPAKITDRDVVYDTLVNSSYLLTHGGTSTSGTLSSSTYPDPYAACTDETYLIDAGANQRVTFQITGGTLGIGAPGDTNVSDHLFLYDGNQSDSRIIMHATGYTGSFTGTYTSTGRYMYVRLASDTDVNGTGFTGNVSFSASSTPTAPTSLTAKAVSSSQISLSWTDNSNETGFEIGRATNADFTGASLTTFSVAANINTFQSVGLDQNTTYYYRVRATVDGTKNSTYTTQNAKTLTAPWMPLDVGAVGAAGSTVNTGANAYTINGAGTGVAGTADKFQYLFQKATGNCSIIAQVSDISGTSSQAGVMIRETLDANSPQASFLMNLNNTASFIRRTTVGGSSTTTTTGTLASPHWVKIERVNNTFYVYASTSSTSWGTAIGSVDITMGSEVYIGLAMSSKVDATLGYANFSGVAIASAPKTPTNLIAAAAATNFITLSWIDNSTDETGFEIERSTSSDMSSPTQVNIGSHAGTGLTTYSVTGLSANTKYYFRIRSTNAIGDSGNNLAIEGNPSATTLPTPWTASDVGDVWGVTGSSSYNSGTSTYTITSGGERIGNGLDTAGSKVDGFRFVYQQIAGDCTVIARVTSISDVNGHPWTRAGVMIRETLDAGSKDACIVMTNKPSAKFTYRTDTNAYSVGVNRYSLSIPYWVRLVRSGNTFTAYASSSSTSWGTALGSATISMNTVVYVGMVACSHQGSYQTTATLTNFSLTGTSIPNSPVNLAAAVASSSQINLSWYDTTSETGFKIERATDSAFSSNFTSFTTSANATTFQNTGLVSGTTYYYRVRAMAAAGDSAPSTYVSATPTGGSVPQTPTLSITGTTGTQISLSWTNVSGETGYKIDRKVGAGSWVPNYTTFGADVTSFNDSGLTNGTLYTYLIRATNGSGDSDDSNEVNSTTIPATPTLTATPVNSTRIDLSWTDVSGETGYEIDRKIGAGSWTTNYTTLAANTTSFQNTGLTASTLYTYVIRATNGSGNSDNSTERSATTPSTALLDENFDDGVADNWSVKTGTWSVSSNKYQQTSTTAGRSVAYYSNGTSWTDYTYSADVKSGVKNGITFRGDSNMQNYYAFRFISSTQVDFNRIVNGSWTTTNTYTYTSTVGQTYTMSVVLNGSSMTMYVNSTNVGTKTDATFSSGTVGFCCYNMATTFDNVLVTEAAMRAAGGEMTGREVEALTLDTLDPVAAEAMARWEGVLSTAGEVHTRNALSDDVFDNVSFVITDLEGDMLGMTDGSTVYLDRDAAGYGWYTDALFADDLDFLDAKEGAGMDLLTVVSHELGHVLGLGHSRRGVMSETLEEGVRLLPTFSDLHRASAHNDGVLGAALSSFFEAEDEADDLLMRI